MKLVLGQRINLDEESEEVRKSVQSRYLSGTRTFKIGESGEETIEADIVFFCTGAKVNKKSYENEKSFEMDEHGRLKVNEFLQLSKCLSVFSRALLLTIVGVAVVKMC